MSKDELLEKIIVWRETYGERRLSKTKWEVPVYVILVKQRRDLYGILLEELRAAGVPREFFTNSTRDFMVDESTPYGKKFKDMKAHAKRDLNEAIVIAYNSDVPVEPKVDEPTPELPKIKEESPTPLEIVYDEEMSEFLGYKKDE